MFRFAGILLFGFFCACTGPHSNAKIIQLPFEEMVLLQPRSEVVRQFVLPPNMNQIDVGIDFDGNLERVTLQVRNPSGAAVEGTRISGSNMRRVVCGFTTDGRISVSLVNHRFSSLRVAVRVAKTGSPMCNVPMPVMDEYWALHTFMMPTKPWPPGSQKNREHHEKPAY